MICPVTGTRCESTGCTVYIDGRCGMLPKTESAAAASTSDSEPSQEDSGAHAAADHDFDPANPEGEVREPAAPAVDSSGTPRTDAVLVSHEIRWEEFEVAIVHLARMLERELSRLTRELEEARKNERRYLLLKKHRSVILLTGFFGNGCINKTLDQVDVAIDALSGGGGEG